MSKERVVVGISLEDARRVVLAGDRRWSMVMAKYNFGKGGPCGSTGQWYTARYCANLEERLAVPCRQPLSKVGDWWSDGGFVLYDQRGHVVAELRLKAIGDPVVCSIDLSDHTIQFSSALGWFAVQPLPADCRVDLALARGRWPG